MTNFFEWPHNVAMSVKGEHRTDGGTLTRWRVDSDGVLHVTHDPGDFSELITLTFRLVEVEQKWVEVDDD